MTKHPTEEQLLLYFENKVTDVARAEIKRHLAVCPQCAMELAVMGDLCDGRHTMSTAELSSKQVERFRLAAFPASPHGERARSGAETTGAGGVGMLSVGIGSLINALRPAFHGPAAPSFATGRTESSGDSVRSDGSGHSVGSERAVAGNDSAIDHSFRNGGHNMSNEFVEPEKIHGTPPDANPAEIQQHYQDTCAVRSQEIVLRDFGIDVSEDQLRAEAMARGWYAPDGGTPAAAVGNLLEMHGVEVNRFENANIFNLQNELAQGHRVIVGVDSGELWNAGFLEKLEDKFGISGADHALVVSSIDTTDPDQVKVVLTDPGTGQVAAVYTQDQFQNAWKDSNCFMVATKDPAPPWASGMANFDYAQGHLDKVGDMPYDHLDAYSAYAASGDADSETMERLQALYDDAIHDYDSMIAKLGLAEDLHSAADKHEAMLRIQNEMLHKALGDETDAGRHSHDAITGHFTLSEGNDWTWHGSSEDPCPDQSHDADDFLS